MLMATDKDMGAASPESSEREEGIPEYPGHGAILPAGWEGQKDKTKGVLESYHQLLEAPVCYQQHSNPQRMLISH
ncbi:hypothetical protein AAES_07603 [Amazona aestiva]|uniref:Uncharacterized protein n=1 Tax=Amazona aestiva TaxID=12930 RepID=A0A0Q3U3K0_AMAAE|nr:hypothetical protein AAES_07603 [Amazona aestiva]